VNQRRAERWKAFAAAAPRGALRGREDRGVGIANRDTGSEQAPSLDPGANRVGNLEESSTGERPGRPGFDDRIDRVMRHPSSSCDLFDGEDVRENGHGRGAAKGKSLASSACADLGQIRGQCRFRPSPPAVIT
jgi:hypothetical protein